MLDDTSSTSNNEKSNLYITLESAAGLAKSPVTYIEHLCRDGQIAHSFDKSGGFLPSAADLVKVLGLSNEILSNLVYVNSSNITDNENGLPTHWKLKTSRDAKIHFDDKPLFPVLIEKKQLLDVDSDILLHNDIFPLVESVESKQLLQSPLIDNPIIENNNPDLIQDRGNVELESGQSDLLVESGKISDDLLLSEGLRDTAYKLELELETPKVLEIDKREVNTEKPQELYFKESTIEKTPSVNLQSTSKDTNPEVKIQPQKPRNPNTFAAVRVLPVPHVPVLEMIKSDHYLARPPKVIPFSTNTPSLQTKISAIYTQPDAMASKWLPWMRTSMWSKKNVRKAIHNIEIKGEGTILPAINKNSKPNIVYSPVFLQDNKINIVKTEKVESTPLDKNNIKVFEPAALKVSIVDSFIAPEKVSKEEKKITPVVVPKLEINDSLDSAFFSEYAPKNTILSPIKETEPVVSTILVNKQSATIVPKIDDSWDSAIFK